MKIAAILRDLTKRQKERLIRRMYDESMRGYLRKVAKAQLKRHGLSHVSVHYYENRRTGKADYYFGRGSQRDYERADRIIQRYHAKVRAETHDPNERAMMREYLEALT